MPPSADDILAWSLAQLDHSCTGLYALTLSTLVCCFEQGTPSMIQALQDLSENGFVFPQDEAFDG